jgi:AraC-like DNA-binding protein/TolB-like protein
MEKAKSIDINFIKRVADVVVNHLNQECFSANELADSLSLSREQTHRKLKKNTSLSTGKFIRYIRLLKACVYLMEGQFSVAEISYKTGFNSPSYFNRCFKEEFGVTPGELKSNGLTEQIANKKILCFYHQPEINEVLRSKGIHIDLPIQEKTIKSDTTKKVLLTTGISLLLIFIVISIVSNNHRNDRNVATLVGNGRIAVMPFMNQTGDSSMAQVGDITSSWISSKIDELEGVQTVPYFTTTEYLPHIGILPNDPQNRPTFREIVGAQYFISGNYFLKDQNLYFDAQLVDAYTQESIYNLPVVGGPKDSVMQVIEDLRLKIAGLVANLEEVKLGKLNPPNYEAYKNYLSGLTELRNGLYPSQAFNYFKKAAELESSFMMPHIFLFWFSTEQQRDSILQKIEQIPNITEYEKKAYLELKYSQERNYREALNIVLNALEEYPQDYYFNMEAAHLAKSQFLPELAISLLSQLQDPLKSDTGLLWHYFKVWNYTESMIMLGRYEEALAYLQSIPEEFHNSAIPALFIFAEVKVGKSREEIEETIDNFADGDEKLFAEYLTIAAYEFALISERETSVYFARKAVKLLYTLPNKKAEIFDFADALYLANDLHGARDYLRQILEDEPDNEDLLIFLAQVEAAMGNATGAEKIFVRFEERHIIPWRRHEYEYHIDYLKARVNAQLGKKEESVALLKSALEQGQLRHHWDFDRDIFLKPLFDDPPFKSLVEVNEFSDITAVQ